MAAIHAEKPVALSHSLQQRQAGCLTLWGFHTPAPCSLCIKSTSTSELQDNRDEGKSNIPLQAQHCSLT